MEEYIDISITNLQLHVTEPRKPSSVGRVIERSIQSKKEHRAYSTDIKKMDGDTFRLIFHNPEIEKIIEKAEKEGKKVRFIMPKDGIPVYLGKDASEFIKSKRWQEILKKGRDIK